MITFSYLRVSGKGQVDGDGPERQREAILHYCQTNGIPRPLFEFFEAGVSGTVEAMDRPKFTELLAQIDGLENKTGGVCIVVERIDRLARDLMVSEFLLAECRKRDIPVFASDQTGLVDVASNSGDPTRVLLRQILGALAQWEKSALVHKLKVARERVRKQTGRCEGPRPFGSAPGEAEMILKMRTMRDDGVSLPGIASSLNCRGWRTRSKKLWTRNAVYQVLKRRRY